MQILQKKTILLVEAEVLIAMARARLLQGFGFTVITVNSGDKAVVAVEDNSSICLILMDIDLGKSLAGFDTPWKILRKRNIPLVFLVTSTETELEVKFRRNTSCTFVNKSSGGAVLLSSIETSLELHRVKEKLYESESQRKLLVEALPVMVWLKNTKGEFLSCNSSFEQFVGECEADIIGKTDYDLVSCEQADSFWEKDLKALSSGIPVVSEERITFASDNRQVDMETVKTPLLNREGIPIGVVGISREKHGRLNDLPYMKRAFESSLSQVFELLNEASFIVDLHGIIRAWNRSMFNLTGYASEAMIGKGDYEYSLPFYGFRRAMLIDLVFNPHQKILKKYPFVKKIVNGFLAEVSVTVKGVNHVFESLVHPLYDSRGNVSGAVESFCNITKGKTKGLQISLLSFAFNQIPLAVYLIDYSGHFLMVNDEACRILGYRRAELLAMTVSDIDSAWDFLRSTKKDGEQIAEGSRVFVSYHKMKNGRVFPVEISSDFFSYEDVLYNCAMVRDISDRERTGKIKSLVTIASQISQELIGLVSHHEDGGPTRSLRELGFSARQIEIVKLILIGEPSKAIAGKLDLAESTIKFHLSSIYTKLKVQGRMELGAYIAEKKIRLE